MSPIDALALPGDWYWRTLGVIAAESAGRADAERRAARRSRRP